MNQKGTRMIGIGYEGLTVGRLIECLLAEGVDVLVDVRLNAISRKAGFSKRALSAALANAGIEYIHDPQLGNPKDNRAGYSEVGTNAGIAARDRFREILGADEGSDAVNRLARCLDDHTVAVLCFEADERNCHREQVIGAVLEARKSPAYV
ncbi:MAG: DUF488 domain-containing protein [Microbacteriaceae bacterium]|nr:DUF488 domain-containing protein [Microbacteriaceae bacterium]